MKEVGGPAYLAQLTGSGAAVIGARDFAAADLRPRVAARADRRRPRPGRRRARHERGRRPARPDRAGRDRALQGRRGGRRRGQGQVLRRGDQATRSRWPRRALNSGGHLSGITTGLDGLNAQDRRASQVRPDHRRRPPGHGQDLARAPTSPSPPPSASCATRRTGSSRTSRPARRSPCSASKCRPTSSPRASSPSSRGSAPKTCAWARSASRSSATSRAPPAELQSLPLYIDDTPGLTIAALRTRARRLKRQKGIGMVVVDYLQLLQGTGQERATTTASRKFPRSAAA